MTLLGDVITGASGDAQVPQLLRQLKVLAARTSTARLSDWVGHELNGYQDHDTLPAYRGPFDVAALGHFMGPFQSELKNVAIPPVTVPEQIREGPLFKLRLDHPIAEIEYMASESTLRLGWPADAVQYYNYGLQTGDVKPVAQPGMVLAAVVQPVPTHVFIGVLDAVRTKVLDLALELERVAPEAGQPGAEDGVSQEAAQVINTYNFHGSSNVAINSSRVTQVIEPPPPHDVEALLSYLGAAGVNPERLVDLKRAVEQDEAEAEGADGSRRWPRARQWFAAAATDIGTGALGSALSTASMAFLGG